MVILQLSNTAAAASGPLITFTGLKPMSVPSTWYLASLDTTDTTIGRITWWSAARMLMSPIGVDALAATKAGMKAAMADLERVTQEKVAAAEKALGAKRAELSRLEDQVTHTMLLVMILGDRQRITPEEYNTARAKLAQIEGGR